MKARPRYNNSSSPAGSSRPIRSARVAEPNNRGPRSPSAPFQTEVVVRFGDCDPAGIVFYPRYLEFFNNIVEDWCREGLKFSFDEIVIKRGWGLPTVHLDVDF